VAPSRFETYAIVFPSGDHAGPSSCFVPSVIWLFWNDQTGWGTALLIWSVGVGLMDNILRPLLIRRGADLPMLLIFAGVIGGLIAGEIISVTSMVNPGYAYVMLFAAMTLVLVLRPNGLLGLQGRE